MLSLKARWIVAARGELIRDGVVYIENGRILEIRQGRAGQGGRDLGNVALLPGLVNAHTHLELTDIAAPLGRPGIPLVEWIGLVVGQRRQADYNAARALRHGLDQSASAGVAVIGDIVQPSSAHAGPSPGSSESAAAEAGVRVFSRAAADPSDATMDPQVAVTGFLELIGPVPARIADALAIAKAYVGAGEGRGTYQRGLSPHAPYSTGAELIEGACRLSRRHHIPVAFHLAESREEMEFLHRGTGPFRELLARLGSWDPAVHCPGRRPLDFLQVLADADRALVIHGNYLDRQEAAFLAKRRDRMTVVYCPRTHAWFQHDPYPLESMLAAGVSIALGTDSRASSPDLNLLEEIRTVAKRHPHVPPEKIIEMGTLAGAKALGRDADFGSLEPGKLARFTIVGLPDDKLNDPYGAVLSR